MKTSRTKFKTFMVSNSFGEKLKTTVFLPDHNTHKNCCILYLHGYGSHRLEGLTILEYLPKSYGLCCFDFSGSGKS